MRRGNSCYTQGVNLDCPPVRLFSLALLGPLLSLACGASQRPGASRPAEGASIAQPIPSPIPFVSLEGPFWVKAGGYLISSDVVEQNGPAARIYRFDPSTRAFSTVEMPGGPTSTNGLAVDANGGIIACERWNGVLSRVSAGVRTALVAQAPSGETLNAPNDLTIRSDGNIYFSDTTWGAKPGKHATTAVYRLAPDGALSTAFAVDMPNGVVLSPDGSFLYVGSDAHDRLWRLPVAPDGSVGTAEPFGESGDGQAKLHVPDGLCVDDRGRLYVANNSADVSAIVILDSSGRFAGRIPVPEPPSNCSFGGEDRRTLYVTTLHALYEIRVDTPGLP